MTKAQQQDEEQQPAYDYIDPTDHAAVAAFIDAHGIEEFQRVRNAQVGTLYPGIA